MVVEGGEGNKKENKGRGKVANVKKKHMCHWTIVLQQGIYFSYYNANQSLDFFFFKYSPVYAIAGRNE